MMNNGHLKKTSDRTTLSQLGISRQQWQKFASIPDDLLEDLLAQAGKVAAQAILNAVFGQHEPRRSATALFAVAETRPRDLLERETENDTEEAA